mmetsp:Transcript_8061/g.25762  ORF Transcript_8061/g.25762 Transcript_8061/m.25762 type:complete len:202 (-) Transcript_8061:149-754(-)
MTTTGLEFVRLTNCSLTERSPPCRSTTFPAWLRVVPRPVATACVTRRSSATAAPAAPLSASVPPATKSSLDRPVAPPVDLSVATAKRTLVRSATRPPARTRPSTATRLHARARLAPNRTPWATTPVCPAGTSRHAIRPALAPLASSTSVAMASVTPWRCATAPTVALRRAAAKRGQASLCTVWTTTQTLGPRLASVARGHR